MVLIQLSAQIDRTKQPGEEIRGYNQNQTDCNKYCEALEEKKKLVEDGTQGLGTAIIDIFEGSALHSMFRPRPHCVSSVLRTHQDRSFTVCLIFEIRD